MKNVPARVARLGDLWNWHRLTASCLVCGRRRELRMWQLHSRTPDKARLVDVQARLRCQRCGNRGQCVVLVEVAPPVPKPE